ncbi:hypothetical protein [Dactylosporangium sp. NPDC051541]|uniref:hypothetical protein n=1 Tax=Dactylosporangium sp. NPDC051541 TaxID=3363977 RepID=UPI0037AEF673
MPTNRPVSSLAAAIELATDLKCLLLVLCSRWSNATPAVREARAAGARVIAVDVPPRARLPVLETDALLRRLPSPRSGDTVPTVFPPDTSMKRNLGLAVAHMLPWRTVLFLDDDIVTSADDVRAAAGLLRNYDAVGLENTGYPDNSVVYHARRAAGERQDTFIGGGALLVPAGCGSHFPNVYNEDWFFLFDDIRAGRVALSGQAEQRRYDPFDRPARAREQEFGDCLAEGLYALLDDRRDLADAFELDFWRGYLALRADLIADIDGRSARADVRASLKASREALAEITPERCVKFLAAWQRDRGTWSAFLGGLPERDDIAGALRYLGLRPIGQE